LGWHQAETGSVAQLSGELEFSDILGSWKARWGIGRMSYIVPPGLYALGMPDENSPVVVTANYKMSYDLVRNALAGRNIWMLVLETYGINVWCAAGKGTFGTGELVRRIERVRLKEVVTHRQLLLPIMGAAGVKALEVKKRSGFGCIFSTLRIADLPAYLDAGMKAAPFMKELTFGFYDRLVLTPMEVVGACKSLLYVGIPLALMIACAGGAFSPVRLVAMICLFVLAILAGAVVTPLLLPYLPGRMFSLKGALAGLLSGIFPLTAVYERKIFSFREMVALILILVTVSSFYAMNFTGSTPFTSPSGVRREMRRSVPLMATGFAIVLLLVLTGYVIS